MQYKCPICGHEAKLIDVNKIGESPVVCINEDYVHVIRGGRHFVAHTERNIVEETVENVVHSLSLC